MNIHCQNKLVTKRKMNSSEHTTEIVVISLYKSKLSYCDHDLENRNPFFKHDTLAYTAVSPYWGWLQKHQRYDIIQTSCDTDLEHSNPIFSLNTSLLMIHLQTEFGCIRLVSLQLIKDTVETNIFWLYKPTLWPWPWRQNPPFFFFSHNTPAHGGAPQYQVWLQVSK